MEPTSIRIACQGCTKCQLLPADVREALSSDTPISSAHVAPRLGRLEKDLELDGMRVADDSSEAMLGTKGWILRFHTLNPRKPTEFHFCPFCKKEPCMYVSRGKVEARREPSKIVPFADMTPADILRIYHG